MFEKCTDNSHGELGLSPSTKLMHLKREEQKSRRRQHYADENAAQKEMISEMESIITESANSICRDSADTQYIMLIQTISSKFPKQLTYKPL